jgi:hypothetical protein
MTLVELLPDAQGVLSGRAKVRATLQYHPKSDTVGSTFHVDITNPSGQIVLGHFDGTGYLTRIQVEALP